MRHLLWAALVVPYLVSALHSGAKAGDDDKNPLEGVWVAQSIEADSKPAPAESVKRMRFTFKGDKVLVRGNFNDDREEEGAYKADFKQSPKHLEFTLPKAEKPILGIYEVDGDELKICLRHASSSDGRPTEFAYIVATAEAARKAWSSRCTVLDFTDLQYDWGDEMEWVTSIGWDRVIQCHEPLGIVVGEKRQAASKSPLREEFEKFCLDILEQAFVLCC